MKSPAELTELFRASGRTITPQRQLIFGLLHDDTTHPTAEAVHAAAVAVMPTMSLRTVYQTLNDLAAMGELQLLDLGTGSTRFDPNVSAHHHLVCTGCGAVRDVFVEIPGLSVPDGERQGFTVTGAEVVFRGRCAGCSPTRRPDHDPLTEREAHA